MASTYSSLDYHLVFSTKNREPWLIESVCDRLWPYLGGIARGNGMKAPEIGGAPDHVHIFVSVPATMTLSKAMQLIKGGSSHWIKDFGRRYATRFAFGVVKPALKRGPTLVFRYCGKVKLVIGQAALRCPLANASHFGAPRS
jgi:REP element-mobilizing transposase RayT